jgi:dipeptidyl aminopeptidase/acylaminoacyl peptidase
MKKLATAITILLLAASASAQRAITFEDMAAMRRIGAPKVSPDGKWVAYDASTIDLAGNKRTSAVYLVPADGSAPSRKVTDGTKQDDSPAWSPDGKTIAYVSNKDGGQKQVYLLDVASGTSKKVSDLTNGAGGVQWTHDGTAVVVSSDVYPDCGVDPKCNEDRGAAAEKAPSKARVIDNLFYRHWNAWADPTRSHLVYVPIGGGAPRDLTPGGFAAEDFDVSPDGKEVAFTRNTDQRPEVSTNSDVFLVSTTGGEAKRLTTRTGGDAEPRYSPDGKWIAYRSQSRAGYESDIWELWLYDRASGQSKRIAGDFPDGFESIDWAADSKTIFAVAPLKGKNALFEVTLDGRATMLDNSGSIESVDVARDGRALVFAMSTLRRPSDIYAMTRGAKSVKRLTTDNDALLAQIAMSETSDMWWTGADGAQVQGHLVKPPFFDPSKKYPAIVLIHGGPQGAWGDAWSYRWNPQIFAAHGYVILMPNPRGSSGFGQKFVEEISRDWGGKVYTDIMNGVDAFAALPYVDGNRMGAAGGSYGGYMVDWILGHSNRFKALVSHAGVYNLESMYGVTEELWFPEWEFGGNPWDNPELYTKWSPHRFVKNFATPTLVTHGELDFRVPIDQGLQLFTALQRRGIPSRLLYFPDEGHWVLKPQNSKLWFQTVGDWFDRWLKA